MASATEHRPVPNGNANGHLNGGAPKQVATRVADDDDSVGGTEQFPAFDPLHDGSEEDVAADDDNEHYTHAFGSPGAAGLNGDGPHEEQSSPHADNSNDNDNDNDNEDEDDLSTPLSTVDPALESEHRSFHDEDDDDDDDATTTATSAVTSPSIMSPPYWQHGHGDVGPSHDNGNGNGALSHPHYNHSAESLVPGAITLQDNEADEGDDEPTERRRNSEEMRTSYGRDRNRACWAKSVEVTDYVVVNGSATNIGAFVVWNIRVETLSGPYMNIRKRYSEFDDFRRQLIRTFPSFEAAVPALPPKSVITKFRPRFLEKRRAGLQYFLNCILLNPEFSGSPVLKDFLFS